jgi:hypothetical protein
MKKTLIALAAAATVSLGTIGAASAAPASTLAGGLDMTAQTAAVQKVDYSYNYYRNGYRNYGYGYEFCKHLYYKGWVLDFYWARVEYYRHCTYRYTY